MDILLVDPPYLSLKGLSTDCGYHVGLTGLAAYLRDAGIETAVLMADLLTDFPSKRIWASYDHKDYAAAQRDYLKIANDKNHIIWKRLAEIVKQANPRVVGLSYLTPSQMVIERIAGLIKEVDPEIKIVAGSCHPTFCPEEVMQNPDIDFVIRGEGEIPLLSLVTELKKDSPKWDTVPGIHYRDRDGQLQANPGVDLIDNLDELPFLARELMLHCDYNVYRDHSMVSGRGCPYTCTFCADRKLWGRVRRRSVDNVIKELRHLKDSYKLNLVDFVDGTFTFDRKYLQAFCNAMIDNDLGIKWRCTARYDNLDRDLLKLMKRANCSGLYFGLESGSNRILKLMDKQMTVEDNIKMSKIVHNSGIPSAASILLGLPGESREEMEATLRAMREIKADILDINSYVPLPGAPLYDSMSEEDKEKIDWGKVALKSLDNYFLTSVSRDEFERYLYEAYAIANNLYRKTVIRYMARAPLRFMDRVFTKLRK